MSDLLEKLKQQWVTQHVNLGQSATEEELLEFESQFGVVIPDDFRQYLASINGMQNFDVDDNHICFWPLNRIRSEAELSLALANPFTLFRFADWSIYTHEYAIHLSHYRDMPTPIYVTYEPALKIASSFTEFIERYLKKDDEILYP